MYNVHCTKMSWEVLGSHSVLESPWDVLGSQVRENQNDHATEKLVHFIFTVLLLPYRVGIKYRGLWGKQQVRVTATDTTAKLKMYLKETKIMKILQKF